MIAILLGEISAIPFMSAKLCYGAIMLAVLLFPLSIHRAGEHAGQLTERLEATEKINEVQRRMLEATARRSRGRDELIDRLRDGGFCCMSTGRGVQSGVSGAGSRGIGAAAGQIVRRRDDGRLHCYAGSGARAGCDFTF